MNIKELAYYTKDETLKTINLNNMELDLCLLDGDRPDAGYLLNALDCFDDYYMDYEDCKLIQERVSEITDCFHRGITLADYSYIFAIGKYEKKEYLLQIVINISNVYYTDSFDYIVEVDNIQQL